jgi:hypothetical protein
MWESSEWKKIHLQIVPKLRMSFFIRIYHQLESFKIGQEGETGHTKNEHCQRDKENSFFKGV